MLARVSHAVLLIAVLVLSVVLVRTSRQPSTQPAPADNPLAALSVVETVAVPASLLHEFDVLGEPSDEIDWSDVNTLAMNQVRENQAAPSSPNRAVRQPNQAPLASPMASGDAEGNFRVHGPRFTPELLTRCVEVAREVDAELGARLAEARDKNPQEFDRLMRQGGVGRRLVAMAQLKQRDPDLYQQKLAELSHAVQIDRVARQLRDARSRGSQGDIDMYEAQLRTLLQIQLAMSIKARGDTLCRLEDRIADLRKELERDAMNFTSIVEARMKVLANEPAASPAAPKGPAQADQAPPANPAPAPVG